MVIPGFGACDASTVILRSYLKYLGYEVRGWELGVNRGNVEELLTVLTRRAEAYSRTLGTKIRLAGWILGGYRTRPAGQRREGHYARKPCRWRPEIYSRCGLLPTLRS